jgi:hypothetical protein
VSDIEDLLARRGITGSYESIRQQEVSSSAHELGAPVGDG